MDRGPGWSRDPGTLVRPGYSLITVYQGSEQGPEEARTASSGMQFVPVMPWAVRTDAWAESNLTSGNLVFPALDDPGYPDSVLPSRCP